jgi:hypothetical protein
MVQALRSRLAWRAIRAAAAGRSAPPWSADPAARSLLVVLPTDASALPAAWALVGATGLPVRQVIPVYLGADVLSVPDRHAGGVLALGASDLDWRGLPRRVVSDGLWMQRPEVALNLAPPDHAAAAFLVAGAPAALRIGFHADASASCYDLQCASDGLPSARVEAMHRLLAQIRPAVLPFS